ncbi:MAG: hypothetical protein C0408_05160 [Odoribacter sp.]|nr:hypothetical protein [Odoribacter sp.]
MRKMKKLIVAVIIGISALSLNLSAQKMTGMTAIPSGFGPGIGYRQWVNPKIGWGLEVMPSWVFNDVIARGRFMYAFKQTEKARIFGLASIGYMALNEKYSFMGSSVEYSVSSPSVVVGAGAEWLVGFKKNKGIGVELGYQYGQSDYSMTMDIPGLGIIPVDGTYKLSPLYIGVSVAFYFSKSQ